MLSLFNKSSRRSDDIATGSSTSGVLSSPIQRTRAFGLVHDTTLVYFQQTMHMVAALVEHETGDSACSAMLTFIADTRTVFASLVSTTTDATVCPLDDMIRSVAYYAYVCIQLSTTRKTALASTWAPRPIMTASSAIFSWMGLALCDLDTETILASNTAVLHLMFTACTFPRFPPRQLLATSTIIVDALQTIPRNGTSGGAEELFPTTKQWIDVNCDIVAFFETLRTVMLAFGAPCDDNNDQEKTFLDVTDEDSDKDSTHNSRTDVHAFDVQKIAQSVTYGVAALQYLCRRINIGMDTVYPALVYYTKTADAALVAPCIGAYQTVSLVMTAFEQMMLVVAHYATPWVDYDNDEHIDTDPFLLACSVVYIQHQAYKTSPRSDFSKSLNHLADAKTAWTRARNAYASECANGQTWTGFVCNGYIGAFIRRIGIWIDTMSACVTRHVLAHQSPEWMFDHESSLERQTASRLITTRFKHLDTILATVAQWSPAAILPFKVIGRETVADLDAHTMAWTRVFIPTLEPTREQFIKNFDAYFATYPRAYRGAPPSGLVQIDPLVPYQSKRSTEFRQLVDIVAKRAGHDPELYHMLVAILEEHAAVLGGVEKSIIAMISTNMT